MRGLLTDADLEDPCHTQHALWERQLSGLSLDNVSKWPQEARERPGTSLCPLPSALCSGGPWE